MKYDCDCGPIEGTWCRGTSPKLIQGWTTVKTKGAIKSRTRAFQRFEHQEDQVANTSAAFPLSKAREGTQQQIILGQLMMETGMPGIRELNNYKNNNN
jgi:hypothetical protein